jgi:ketosteroid isomerase-like protein
MEFTTLMNSLAKAASEGDGAAVAALFTEDGVYHDVYYGAFKGREAIENMVKDLFHGHAKNFIWDFHEPVSDGTIGYARYVFSYESTLPECVGNRAMFEGVSRVELEGGKVKCYSEVANIGPGLVSLGFPPDRTCKILEKHSKALQSREESRHHFD